MQTKKSILIDIGIAVGLVVVAVAGYLASPLLLPVTDATNAPEAGCDLNLAPCSAVLPGGGKLTLTLSPHPIPMVKPFVMNVALSGKTADKLAIDFTGATMNMGFNRPSLQPQGNGRFAGEASLPVCVTGGMDWVATVLLESGRERFAIPFRFSTGSHN